MSDLWKNLSLAEFQAIPTASDGIESEPAEDGSAFEVGGQAGDFADEDLDTAWMTRPGVSRHWAMLRWRNVVVSPRLLELHCAPQLIRYRRPRGFFETQTHPAQEIFSVLPSSMRLEVRCYGSWQEICPTFIPSFGQDGILRLPLDGLSEIDALRLHFEQAHAGDVVAVREMKVWGPAPATSFAFRPRWLAHWIWGDSEPPCANHGIVRRYFRKVFSLLSPPSTARLYFIAQDRGTLWLNGCKLAETTWNGRGMEPALIVRDIPVHLLRQGANLLAILGEDVAEDRRRRGVLAELWLGYADGSSVRLGTDETFSFLLNDDPGWNDALEDPAASQPCRIIADPNAEFPWTNHPTFHPPCQEGITVRAISCEPAVPQAGRPYVLRIAVSVRHPLADSYGVICEWGWESPVQVRLMDFRLGECFLSPAQGLAKGFKGDTVLSLTGCWPGGVPPRVPATIRFCHAGGQLRISSAITGDDMSGTDTLRFFVGSAHFETGDFPATRLSSSGRLLVDGRPTAPVFFSSSLQTVDRYARWLEGGVRLFRIAPHPSCDVVPPHANAQAHYDKMVKSIEVQAEAILAMHPDARFLLTTDIEMPNEWTLSHPEEMIELPNHRRQISIFMGESAHGFHYTSPASQPAKAVVEDAMKGFIRTLRRSHFAYAIIGLVMFHGRGGENYWGLDVNLSLDDAGHWEIPSRSDYVFGDVGLAARRSFRDWLRDKYSSPETLSLAWKTKVDAFDDIVSSLKWPNKRIHALLNWHARPGDRFTFRDASEEGCFHSDFLQHHNEARAHMFLNAARAAKEASDGRLLVGAYLGYVVPAICNSPPAASQHSGHQAFRLFLESRDVDFVPSPNYYYLRRAGDPVMPMGVVDSLRLHGKMWINEFDTRTHLSPIVPKTFDLAETRQILRRDFAYAVSKGQGWWWLEFPFHAVGRHGASWFDDDTLLQDTRLMQEIYQASLSLPECGSVAECAVIFDAEQPYHTDFHSPANTVGSAVSNFLIPRIFSSGPPFDLFAMSDLSELCRSGCIRQYKVIFFVNAWHLDSAARQLIECEVKAAGRTVVFIYAPGYLGGEGGRSVKDIEHITGMQGVHRIARRHLLGARLSDGSIFDVRPWWEEGQIENYGHQIAPVFYLSSSEANGWETLISLRLDGVDHFDKTVLARQRDTASTTYYSTLPDLPVSVLSDILTDAGLHSYSDKPGPLTWAGEWFLGVHGVADGDVTLKARHPVRWYEPFERRLYAEDSATLTVPLSRGQTRFFCLEQGDIRLFSRHAVG